MDKPMIMIGRAELVSFPEISVEDIPSRIDTGAKTSAIWASGIIESKHHLQFVLFGPDSPYYTGEVLTFTDYGSRSVASSNGMTEDRYLVKLLVTLHGRKIRATFTLANRSQQAYPILIGRNVLRSKFTVDVNQGIPKTDAEKQRSKQLQQKTSVKGVDS